MSTQDKAEYTDDSPTETQGGWKTGRQPDWPGVLKAQLTLPTPIPASADSVPLRTLTSPASEDLVSYYISWPRTQHHGHWKAKEYPMTPGWGSSAKELSYKWRLWKWVNLCKWKSRRRTAWPENRRIDRKEKYGVFPFGVSSDFSISLGLER